MNLLKQNPAVIKLLRQYEAMPSRDRMALKLLGLVLIILVLYFAMWLPAYEYKKQAASHVQQQKDLLALVVENKSALKSLSSSRSGPTSSLNSQQLVTTVTNLAKQADVLLKRFEPSGEKEIKVWVDDVPFDKVITWLSTMKRSLNIRVEQISLDKADAQGMVSARLTLSS